MWLRTFEFLDSLMQLINIYLDSQYDISLRNICVTDLYHLQIKHHFKDGYLHKNEFKIVYVAPMKVDAIFSNLQSFFLSQKIIFIMYSLGIGCRSDCNFQPPIVSIEYCCARTYWGHATYQK